MATTYSIKNEAGETMTFDNAWITSYSTAIAMNEKDGVVMPGTGPMNNQIYDYNGVTKIISMSGVIFDVATSVVTDSGDVTITGFDNILAIRLWLEALLNGQQQAKTFISPQDSKSLATGGGTTSFTTADNPTLTENINIQGDWTETTVFVVSVEFPDAEENVGNKLPFTLTLEVSI